MRYSVPVLALALTAVAEPTLTFNKPAIVQRGLPEITAVLAQVSDLTGKLDTAVQGFTTDFKPVQAASDAVNDAVKAGIAKVSGGQLDLQGALGVQAPVQDLTKVVEKTVDDTIAKKEAFSSSNNGGAIYKNLVAQKAGSDELSKTISSQVPESLQEVAAALSAGISTALQKGIDAFKEFEGQSGGSSSGGSSSGGSSSGSSGSGSGSGSGSSGSSSGSSSGGASSGSSSSGGKTPSTGTSSGSGSASRGGAASTSAPAQFTGAGSVNSFSVVGVLAAVAVALAF